MSERHTLDARRLLCPLPLIRVQDCAKTMFRGDILEVSCTDPGTLYDIPTWCQLHGHRVLHVARGDPVIVFTIEIAGTEPDSVALTPR